jgi:glycosyltransferase involved in cell wall biosynthesis
MKILIVHNYYGSAAPSGENTVFETERKLLFKQGHTVLEHIRHSDEIRDRGKFGIIQGALSTPWNPFSLHAIRSILINEQPDIMHVHNTFPLLSPAIYYAAKNLKTATVLTLHNYRTYCAAGIPMRNETSCIECLDKKTSIPSLKYGCYRDSKLATLPMALMIELHRKIGTWTNNIDSFIALTEFQKKTFIHAGLPEEKVYVKPHFYEGNSNSLKWNLRKDKIVFIGRLGKEKGCQYIIDVWEKWNDAPIIEIIGDGPQKNELQIQILKKNLSDKIKLLGQQSYTETQKLLSTVKLLIIPSICFEGFPMVIREAFAHGVPVAGSDIGSIPDIVDDGVNGVLFKPGNSEDILEKVKGLWNDQDRLELLAKAAKEKFEKFYTADINYQILMDIYQKAIENRKGK